jgi:hypothetical protein
MNSWKVILLQKIDLTLLMYQILSIYCGCFDLQVRGCHGGTMQITVTWHVIPCGLTDRYQCLWGVWYHHLQNRRIVCREGRHNILLWNVGNYQPGTWHHMLLIPSFLVCIHIVPIHLNPHCTTSSETTLYCFISIHIVLLHLMYSAFKKSLCTLAMVCRFGCQYRSYSWSVLLLHCIQLFNNGWSAILIKCLIV